MSMLMSLLTGQTPPPPVTTTHKKISEMSTRPQLKKEEAKQAILKLLHEDEWVSASSIATALDIRRPRLLRLIQWLEEEGRACRTKTGDGILVRLPSEQVPPIHRSLFSSRAQASARKHANTVELYRKALEGKDWMTAGNLVKMMRLSRSRIRSAIARLRDEGFVEEQPTKVKYCQYEYRWKRDEDKPE